jgi:hypothetical protein
MVAYSLEYLASSDGGLAIVPAANIREAYAKAERSQYIPAYGTIDPFLVVTGSSALGRKIKALHKNLNKRAKLIYRDSMGSKTIAQEAVKAARAKGAKGASLKLFAEFVSGEFLDEEDE